MFGTVKKRFDGDTPPAKEQCACCGRCCASFGWRLLATDHDLQRWRRENRADLLSRVNRLGWLWMDPHTAQLESRCPFLKEDGPGRYICLINDTKPDMCRDYPTLAHGLRCLGSSFLSQTVLSSRCHGGF